MKSGMRFPSVIDVKECGVGPERSENTFAAKAIPSPRALKMFRFILP